MEATMQKITPFLWYDNQAEDAANHYISAFSSRPGAGSGGDSKITDIARYGDAGPGEPGAVMTVAFQLEGEEFIALNGGPDHTFTDAISFVVNCEGQDEVDHFWKLLSDGGEEGPCGWLKDRYGLSWQVIPTALPKLLQDTDPARAQAVMQAMLKMGKIDIGELERAARSA
jgi:predicted 3-demethylubiquinone-9 3-methyltransferase (glyoxalase superfamily)